MAVLLLLTTCAQQGLGLVLLGSGLVLMGFELVLWGSELVLLGLQ